jgi:two-component system chemotaxis sensor kinase CheA
VITDPLLHLLRNAVDHGIEPPGERGRLGKPESGTIRLQARYSGTMVVIEIRDDGRGLDRGAIAARARETKLIRPGDEPADDELWPLLFLPGFSTARQVTDVSGRGVGMDVVQRGVDALKGRIEIQSQPGQGCAFIIRLPLTLAVTDGMLVSVGRQRYIVPTAQIQTSIRPAAESLFTVAAKGEMVRHQDRLLPLYRLHRLFGIDGAETDPTRAILVIVGQGEHLHALMVDQMSCQLQVVEKSLGKALPRIPGIAGGAILGDGQVGLIIDAAELIASATAGGAPAGSPAAA